jgi:hypothetical protein
MKTAPSPVACQARQRLLGALLFASAMGLLEAICVIYLRQLILPAAGGNGAVLPPLGRFPVEHIREACTLIMLLTMAWMAAFNWRSGLAFFFFMFGVWDIVYYAGLKWLAQWPSSWTEWDCLFLIPRPWFGPVLAPVLVSGYFVLAGGLLAVREGAGASLRLSAPVLASQLLGLGLWYWSFVKDSDRIQAQGYAGVSYSWPLLTAGLISALLGLWLAARRRELSAPASSAEPES